MKTVNIREQRSLQRWRNKSTAGINSDTCCCYWWSWRDLNPRPNAELMSFLHAQSLLDCRGATGKRPPITTLASKVSETARGTWSPIPDLPAPPCRSVSGKGQSGDVLSLQLLRRLSAIYCTSIRQQERSYFRHLKF